MRQPRFTVSLFVQDDNFITVFILMSLFIKINFVINVQNVD